MTRETLFSILALIGLIVFLGLHHRIKVTEFEQEVWSKAVSNCIHYGKLYADGVAIECGVGE